MSNLFEDVREAMGEEDKEIDAWTDWSSSPRKLKAEIVRIDPAAMMPTKSTDKAAGYDVYSCLFDPIVIKPGETRFVPTGLSITPPPGYFIAIFARSGIACKNGIRPANCVGKLLKKF